MPNPFVWYELMTSDPAAAVAYYAHVVGWAHETVDTAGAPYSLMKIGDRRIAGIMAMPPGTEGAPPMWFGYVGVDDVDAAADGVKAAGGAIRKGPADIPNVGRFAVAADPQGAAFMLFTGAGAPMPDLPYMAPGSVGWHELHTIDPDQGFGFYQRRFGWEKDETLDMGPMGTYQLWKGAGAPHPIGGVVREDRSYWLYYFAVDDIDAAAARLTERGGTIMHGPAEVPGGAWIVLARDPQGAVFAIVGMKAGGQS